MSNPPTGGLRHRARSAGGLTLRVRDRRAGVRDRARPGPRVLRELERARPRRRAEDVASENRHCRSGSDAAKWSSVFAAYDPDLDRPETSKSPRQSVLRVEALEVRAAALARLSDRDTALRANADVLWGAFRSGHDVAVARIANVILDVGEYESIEDRDGGWWLRVAEEAITASHDAVAVELRQGVHPVAAVHTSQKEVPSAAACVSASICAFCCATAFSAFAES